MAGRKKSGPGAPSPVVPALVLAARAGEEERVTALLAGGASPGAADPSGVSALAAAAAAGHASVVRRLLEAGAPPGAAALDGTTPLLAALARGRVEAAGALLEALAGAGPSWHAAAIEGAGRAVPRWDAARLAAWSGDAALLGAVVGAGAPAGAEQGCLFLLRARERAGGRAVLRSAGTAPSGLARDSGVEDVPDVFALDAAPPLDALPGSLRVACAPLAGTADDAVLADGPGVVIVVDPGAKAARGEPRFFPVDPPDLRALDLHDELCAPGPRARRRESLEYTARRGALEALRALAPEGAAELGGALCQAAASGRRDVVQELLERGADPSARTARLGTALGAAMFASSEGPAIALLLLERGARPDGDPRDEPPLLEAARWSSAEVVGALLERGARPDARSLRRGAGWGKGGETALHVAAGRTKADVVRRLLAGKAPPDARDALGRTALQLACAASAPREIVDLLLDAGADLEVTDERGHTPLLAALASWNSDLALHLLDRGARAGAVAADGSSATRIAAAHGGSSALLELLRQAAARG